MELFKGIYERRSVRRFIDKDIKKEKLAEIIKAATFAPSACNIQGWKFIIINNKKLMEKLVNKGLIKFAKFAPVGILVIYDKRTENPLYKDYMQSASAAIQNMLLAAHANKIGSCWICHLPRKKVLRNIFKIPSYYDVISYVALGYYKKHPKVLPRKFNFEGVASFNKFSFKKDVKPGTVLYRFFKRNAYRIYSIIPYKKYLLKITNKFEKFN